MIDKTIQNALLTLLRLGLWEKHNVETFSSLSEAQWGLLYRYAQEQTIEGIVFDGIQHLPTQHLPPRALLLKWTVRIDQIERHNKQMNTVIKEQLSFFSAQGIHPFLLKGQGVASCYPIPEHRISGDVDWYFEAKEEYHRANDLIKQKRIKLTYTAGFSTEYAWNGIVIEHHCRMFDLYNPFSIPYLNQLEKRFKDQSIPMDLQGNTLLLPAPILMMLQVNAHILKHLLSFGLGIRQLCDAAKVYQQYRAEIDGQQLKEMYRKLGILKWIHLLHAVLVKYISLPTQSLPFVLPKGIDADWMMEEIWLSGNFGFHDERFTDVNQNGKGIRDQAPRRVGANLRRYFKYAPMEAISFPLVHLYSKLVSKESTKGIIKGSIKESR